MRDGNVVLDVACGNGTLLGELSKKAKIQANGILFPSSWTGDYGDISSVNQFFKAGAKKAGITRRVSSHACRDRCCPMCQEFPKERIDARREDILDAPYFHVVFTVPAELNPIIYSNQKSLYNALYHAASDTLSELASDKKYLGAGIEIPDVPETGKTPLENARQKALAYYHTFHIPVFSCDSGLYFDGIPEDISCSHDSGKMFNR